MTIHPAGRSIRWGLAALVLWACGSETEPGTGVAGTSAQSVAGAGTSPPAAAGPGGGAAPASAGSGAQAGSIARAGSGATAPVTGGAPSAAAGATAGTPTAGSGGSAQPVSGTSATPMPAAGSGGAAPVGETVPTIYWLDINSNRVMRSQNFAPGEVIVMRTGTAPDGVAIDVAGGKLYWTNMGSLLGTGGGSLQRSNLDGSSVETIVMPGVSTTPKQMQVDLVNKHVYWSDREGAKVWRAGFDGSNPTAIVSEHGLRECVGIALDVPNGKFYFTDRMGKKILRANIELPAGQTGANRMDVEELFVLTGNASPIDLDIDHEAKKLYWTDRQLGTVTRSNLDLPAGQTAMNRTDAETLVRGLTEPIGMSLDVKNNKMYFTELGGEVSEASLDGSGQKVLFRSASATGVVIAHVPK